MKNMGRYKILSSETPDRPPQGPTALHPTPHHHPLTDLDDLEAEVALVQHDDLVFVRAVIDHVPQREQRVAAGQHRLAPGGVALVADDQAAAVVGDGLVQDGSLLGLLQTGEVVLGVKKMMSYRRGVHVWRSTAQHDNCKDGKWRR